MACARCADGQHYLMKTDLQQWRVADGVQGSTAIAMQRSVWVMGGASEAGKTCAKLSRKEMLAGWLQPGPEPLKCRGGLRFATGRGEST